MTGPFQKLDLRHSQQLVMTPQLQQAIKLLQLNNIELAEFIEEEIEKNPLLEKLDSNNEGNGLESAENSEVVSKEQNEPSMERHNETREAMDAAFEDAYYEPSPAEGSSYITQTGPGGNTGFDDSEMGFENRICADKSLREHLMDQLYVAFGDNRERMIGMLLIDRLDESGYLREDHGELAQRLGCSLEKIETLLKKMKQFDPTGVFASDLKECLALQLEEQNRLDTPMITLLDNLSLLAQHDLKKLTDLCGVNDSYLRDMIEEIRGLNPRPAADFDHLVVQTAIPDVFMRRLPKHLGGGWRVELNSETLPRVLINQEYYMQVSQGSKTRQDKDYLSHQMASANWLVRAMDQRAQTILKVAGEIVEQQDAFFNYGIEFLKPLILRDIAEKIGMHESTVSRVTTNKYIGTPRGIFELKYFFSTALTSEDGSIHSSEAVKARIRSLVDAESHDDILSDDKIVELLRSEGIDLARRTVAKYREAMHIGSSVQRRRQKRS